MQNWRTARGLIAIAFTIGTSLSTSGTAEAAEGYRLPYRAGQSYQVSQGWNTSYSHRGTQGYAIDFAMPEGTPVVASKAGQVVGVKFDTPASACGGPEYAARANYVLLAHGDGTQTLYVHLSSVVEARKRIGNIALAGQVIGLSGKTGWTAERTGQRCGAHLHFQRQTPPARGRIVGQSRPVFFDEVGTAPVPGRSYASRNVPPLGLSPDGVRLPPGTISIPPGTPLR